MRSTDRRGAAGRLRLTALAMAVPLLVAACGGDVDQVTVTPSDTAAPAGASQSPPPVEPPPVEPPPVPAPGPAPPPGTDAPPPPAPEPTVPPERPAGGDLSEQDDPPRPPPEPAAPPDPSEGGSSGSADSAEASGSPQPPEPPEVSQPPEPQERSKRPDDPESPGEESAGTSTAPPVGPVGSANDDSDDTAESSAAPPPDPPPPDPPPPPTYPPPEAPAWYPVTVLVAKDNVNGIVPVYDAPNGNRLAFPDGDLWSYTYRGNRLVLHVVDGIPGDEWVRAELPIRPNGARGWIRTEDFTWSTVRHHILIDVSDRLVALFEGDELVTYTRAIVGTERTPTPALSGFIVEKLPNHDRQYGTNVVGDWILMLSFFSEALDSFSGGLPRIALHGTHIPNEVGTAQSNGCIRIPNDIIEVIARTAPLGTVVNITA